jgi:hypothetical protein
VFVLSQGNSGVLSRETHPAISQPGATLPDFWLSISHRNRGSFQKDTNNLKQINGLSRRSPPVWPLSIATRVFKQP